jgi:hypothetical protein
MSRFRYRTCVLVGPWRAARAEALADAVRSKQAIPAEQGGEIEWRVSGTIEEEAAERSAGKQE